MILSEKRLPLFGIMLWRVERDGALGFGVPSHRCKDDRVFAAKLLRTTKMTTQKRVQAAITGTASLQQCKAAVQGTVQGSQ
jgi:hypothetical protein